MSIRRGGPREDYLLRVIRQAAEALRFLRLRLTQGDAAPAVVRREAAAAAAALLGADAPLLARVDAPTAARLVGDARRLGLWRGLLLVEAAAAEAEGDAAAAAAARARAAALGDALRARWPDADPNPTDPADPDRADRADRADAAGPA